MHFRFEATANSNNPLCRPDLRDQSKGGIGFF
jgi:hypothetical protein